MRSKAEPSQVMAQWRHIAGDSSTGSSVCSVLLLCCCCGGLNGPGIGEVKLSYQKRQGRIINLGTHDLRSLTFLFLHSTDAQLFRGSIGGQEHDIKTNFHRPGAT